MRDGSRETHVEDVTIVTTWSTGYILGDERGDSTGTPLTIAASSASVAYGSPIPAITSTVVGQINGDTILSLGPLVCSTTAHQGSPVGTYPTSCSGAVNPNYTITYVAGTLTITPVPLTITANNATRAVGAPNPAFTATYAGFVNGDTAASLPGTMVCTTTAGRKPGRDVS